MIPELKPIKIMEILKNCKNENIEFVGNPIFLEKKTTD
jgi:hypothetical protein